MIFAEAFFHTPQLNWGDNAYSAAIKIARRPLWMAGDVRLGGYSVTVTFFMR